MSSNLGTMLQIGSGTETVTYASVGKIVKLTLPEITNDKIEVTNHSYKKKDYEYSGLLGLSELGITVALGSDFTLLSNLTNSIETKFKIVFPNSLGEWAFTGLVTYFKMVDSDAKSPDVQSAEIKIQPKGDFDLGLA